MFVNKNNVLFQQDGRANNWAMGYHCSENINSKNKNTIDYNL